MEAADALLSKMPRNLPIASGGGFPAHHDTFPEISKKRIELGGMFWHAMAEDEVWTLDSFAFTDATGEVGTDENGETPP
jgi:hypothetical protein